MFKMLFKASKFVYYFFFTFFETSFLHAEQLQKPRVSCTVSICFHFKRHAVSGHKLIYDPQHTCRDAPGGARPYALAWSSKFPHLSNLSEHFMTLRVSQLNNCETFFYRLQAFNSSLPMRFFSTQHINAWFLSHTIFWNSRVIKMVHLNFTLHLHPICMNKHQLIWLLQS